MDEFKVIINSKLPFCAESEMNLLRRNMSRTRQLCHSFGRNANAQGVLNARSKRICEFSLINLLLQLFILFSCKLLTVYGEEWSDDGQYEERKPANNEGAHDYPQHRGRLVLF
jgi:hypothetical protein